MMHLYCYVHFLHYSSLVGFCNLLQSIGDFGHNFCLEVLIMSTSLHIGCCMM